MRFFASIKVIAAASLVLFSTASIAGSKLAPKPTAVKTVAEGVEVRKDPDGKAEVIATLKKGENLTALDRKGSYWKVKLSDGREGFVPVTSVHTKAGMNAIKSAVSDGAAQVGEAASAVKGAAAEKSAAKPAVKTPEVKAPDVKSQDLEKAANKLFKNK